GGEERLAVAEERRCVEEPGEAAGVVDHLGPPGTGHPGLHQLDGALSGRDVDPGLGVAGHACASSTCLSTRSPSSSGIGYSPVKQARQSRSAGSVVAWVSASSET